MVTQCCDRYCPLRERCSGSVCDTPHSIRLAPGATLMTGVSSYTPLEAPLHMLTHDCISVINKAMLDLLQPYAYLCCAQVMHFGIGHWTTNIWRCKLMWMEDGIWSKQYAIATTNRVLQQKAFEINTYNTKIYCIRISFRRKQVTKSTWCVSEFLENKRKGLTLRKQSRPVFGRSSFRMYSGTPASGTGPFLPEKSQDKTSIWSHSLSF
jgi:hypothetical protein